MTPQQKRNAFWRDLLDNVSDEPRVRHVVPFRRVIPQAASPAAGRMCLSCGARESGGTLPCGH